MGDLASVIVGVGGLLVAAWSLWLSRKGQTSTYREVLFEKQIEAVCSIFEITSPLIKDFVEIIKRTRYPQLGETSPEVMQRFESLRVQFMKEIDQYRWLLPKGMLEDLFLIIVAINTPESERLNIDYAQIVAIFGVIVQEARSMLGVDILEENSASVIGNKKYRVTRTSILDRLGGRK